MTIRVGLKMTTIAREGLQQDFITDGFWSLGWIASDANRGKFPGAGVPGLGAAGREDRCWKIKAFVSSRGSVRTGGLRRYTLVLGDPTLIQAPSLAFRSVKLVNVGKRRSRMVYPCGVWEVKFLGKFG